MGDVLGFGYQVGNVGLGTGFTAEVVSEAGGVITGLKILNRGNG